MRVFSALLRFSNFLIFVSLVFATGRRFCVVLLLANNKRVHLIVSRTCAVSVVDHFKSILFLSAVAYNRVIV